MPALGAVPLDKLTVEDLDHVAAVADASSLKARRRPEIKAWDADQLADFLDEVVAHRL